MNIEEILAQQGLTLPAPPEPAANYTPAVQVDNLVFLSGQTPKVANEVQYQGKVGRELGIDDGYSAAQLCTLRLVSALQACVGDLSKVKKIVKLTVFVNATDDFTGHIWTPLCCQGNSITFVSR